MTEMTELSGGDRLSAGQQEECCKRLIDSIDLGQRTETAGECPFNADQLEFLTMAFTDLMVTMGRETLVLVEYNPIGETYVKWKMGVRLEK